MNWACSPPSVLALRRVWTTKPRIHSPLVWGVPLEWVAFGRGCCSPRMTGCIESQRGDLQKRKKKTIKCLDNPGMGDHEEIPANEKGEEPSPGCQGNRLKPSGFFLRHKRDGRGHKTRYLWLPEDPTSSKLGYGVCDLGFHLGNPFVKLRIRKPQ